MVVDAEVSHDREEPGGEFRRGNIGGRGPMQLDKHVLKDLFGLLRVISIAVDKVINPSFVTSKEFGEGLFITLLVISHQGFVGYGQIKHCYRIALFSCFTFLTTSLTPRAFPFSKSATRL